MDRNKKNRPSVGSSAASLSARRAWIEIGSTKPKARRASVALRKESVDRNRKNTVNDTIRLSSLSARRAWIEIIDDLEPSSTRKSLSARRAWIEMKSGLQPLTASVGRSPQGERG